MGPGIGRERSLRPMAQPLRAAIAGTGFIGTVHARSARLAGATLAGLAASTPERAAEAAARLGAERGYASAEEMVRADEVDVVHLCTPNHLHVPLARAALEAGKHVICEKPIATDAAAAEGLVALAAETGLQGAVPFVYRYYPTVREARDRVRRGETGRVHLIHGTYLQDWLLRAEDGNWRVDAALGGASRAFADIGSHWCDLAEFVTGQRITRLAARLLRAVGDRATEDGVVLQFETDAGALGSAVISQVSAGRKNRLWLEVDGAQEALTFDQEHPETLWAGRPEQTTLLHRDPLHMSPAAVRLTSLPAGHPEGYASCFDTFVLDAYAAIGGASPDGLPTFADGLRAVRITEAVLASAAAEAWVDVPAP
jgi:predicted dehydrogenase